MKNSFNPVRLFLEVILVVALAETLVMLALPVLAPGLTGLAESLLDVVLLVLLCAPSIYWRCIVALRRPAIATANAKADGKRFNIGVAIALTAAVQAIGIALTVVLVLWQKHELDKDAQFQFDRGAERIETEIKRRFNQPLLGLKGARGAYAASRDITRWEFRAYVESRDLPAEFPGIRGFGFVARVMRPDLGTFVATERADHAPEFEVRTTGDAADLFVIKFIEPIADNRPAFGLDIGQEAVRREAAERAMNSGQAALTGKITLAQDGTRSPGWLYFLPVYRQGTDPVTPQQHQAALVGLLYAPMVANELLRGLADIADNHLRVELSDTDGAESNHLLYDSEGNRPAQETEEAAARRTPSALTRMRPVAVGGRILQLRMSSNAAFHAMQDRSSLAVAAVAGALASLLCAATVWLLAVGRLRAQRLAERMTADLDRLARVVQHTSNAVTIADTRMRITWVNAGFTRLTGYTLEEARGKTPGELLGSGKSDPAVIAQLLHAVDRGEACRVEVLNRAKDGHEYWVDTEVQPTHDAEGMLIGFMEIGTDVTAQKLAEVRLKEAVARAEQANLAKSQFLANMSHEIRTPMNAILGMLKLLQSTELGNVQRDYLAKTEGAARSLLGLLNDILDFSKVEAGKMTLDPRAFNLDTVLGDLLVILRANIGDKPVQLRYAVEPTVPRHLLGDDMRLQQVLINLGGNAIKFTATGEVVLRVRTVEAGPDDALLEFAVSDTGIGIAPENQAHIFSGFSQAEASTTRRFGGTGLGLAISSRLVGLLGGELQVDSTMGQGSTFFFQLRFPLAPTPATSPKPRPDTGATPTKPQRLQGLRLLVVEDNKINQMVAKGLLVQEGAQITLADNGQLGVATVANAATPFDAVLMDVQMPVMDGYAATRAIRQDLGLASLPIIAMTANAMASDREACLEAGMNDHVGKPFELDHLVATLLRCTAHTTPPRSGEPAEEEKHHMPRHANRTLR